MNSVGDRIPQVEVISSRIDSVAGRASTHPTGHDPTSLETSEMPLAFPPSRVVRAIALVAATLLMPGALLAQTTGSLSGTIKAASGGTIIQGARVAVQNPAAVAVTDEAGRFSIRQLPAGHYRILITSIGYKPTTKDVEIAGGQAATLDVQLEAGSLLLPGVVVSATRLPTEANRVATTINTLEPEQIRTSPAREAQDLLREIPSVELPRTSSIVSGTAQIVSIRGVDEGRTVVLFDGIPVTDAWGEWVDWSRVPNGMVDRVEVLEGGTSSLYGNGAMGGLISFLSRPMAPGAVSMQLDGGERGSRHGYLGVGVPL